MGSEWKSYKLGDLTSWSSGGTPSKSNEDYWNGNIPWISASSMDGSRYRESTLKITEEGLANGTRLAKKGSILLLVRGSILHQKIQVGIAEKDVAFNQDVKCLVPKVDDIDSWFLLYWFIANKNDLLSKVESTGIGAGKLDTKLMQELEVRVPPKHERLRITSFAKAIDDKIQLNRQTNQTLEQMAQALFKSWFVDFDPVIDNALLSGNDIPEPLRTRAEMRKALLSSQEKPDQLRALFPSEFEHTDELGWVPKGWSVKDITQLVDTISQTYPLKSVDEVIFLNTGDIEAGKFLHSDMSDPDSLPGQAKKSIQEGDILYSEIRPKNRRYAYVNFDSDKYVVSTKLMVLRSKGVVDSKFAYFILTQESTINHLQSIAENRSGTFPQITFKELANIRVALPDRLILDKFSDLFLASYFEKHFQLQTQNIELEKLRDTLLPKLISGELRLPDVESATAEINSAEATA